MSFQDCLGKLNSFQSLTTFSPEIRVAFYIVNPFSSIVKLCILRKHFLGAVCSEKRPMHNLIIFY